MHADIRFTPHTVSWHTASVFYQTHPMSTWLYNPRQPRQTHKPKLLRVSSRFIVVLSGVKNDLSQYSYVSFQNHKREPSTSITWLVQVYWYVCALALRYLTVHLMCYYLENMRARTIRRQTAAAYPTASNTTSFPRCRFTFWAPRTPIQSRPTTGMRHR